jgi:hypothetical protein
LISVLSIAVSLQPQQPPERLFVELARRSRFGPAPA